MLYIPNIQLHLESSKAFFSYASMVLSAASASSRSAEARMTSNAWKGNSHGGWFTQCSSVTCKVSGCFFSAEKRERWMHFFEVFDGDDGHVLLIFDLEV